MADYTEDEAGAIEQLRDGRVEAVILLPPRAYETISAGEAVSVTVLYNQLDPLWRHIVPTFINRLAGQINHTLLVETIGAQQATLADTVRYLDLVLAAIDLAIAAADQGDQGVTRQRVRAAHQLSVRLEERLAALDPEAESLLVLVGEVRRRLAAAEQRLDEVEPGASGFARRPLEGSLGLVEARRRVQELKSLLAGFASVPPQVVISPLEVKIENIAPLEPNLIPFRLRGFWRC